jgi:hypothetical protein
LCSVPSAAELKEKQIRMALDVAIAVGVTIIVILVLAILANLVRRKDPNIGINSDPNAMESGSETSSFLGYSAEHLKLMEVIGESCHTVYFLTPRLNFATLACRSGPLWMCVARNPEGERSCR